MPHGYKKMSKAQRARAARLARQRRYKGGSRRGGRNSLSTIVYRGITPVIADQYMAKFKWNRGHVTPGISSTFAKSYRGNSCFDPDPGAINTQPLGFNELSLLFRKYKVYASSIRVEIISGLTPAPGGNVLIGLVPTASVVAPTSMNNLLGTPYAKTAIIANSHGEGAKVFNIYMTTAKMFGQRSIAQENDYEAETIGSSPLADFMWHWHLFGESMDLSSSILLQYIVTITYYVQFSKRRQLSQFTPALVEALQEMNAV